MTPEQRFCARVSNNRVACAGRQWQDFLALLGREPPRDPVLTDADVEKIAVRVVELLKRQLNQTGDGFNSGEGK